MSNGVFKNGFRVLKKGKHLESSFDLRRYLYKYFLLSVAKIFVACAMTAQCIVRHFKVEDFSILFSSKRLLKDRPQIPVVILNEFKGIQ